MSKIIQKEYKCGLCGRTSLQYTLLSNSAFGAMDMDTRPPAPARHSVSHWVHHCPHCDYVARFIEDKPTLPAEFYKSEEYRTAGGHQMNDSACKFYRNAFIAKAEGNPEKEFEAYLCAAWMCDDAREAENAVLCRTKALEVLDSNPEDAILQQKDAFIVMRADLLRRTKQFAAVNQYQDYKAETEFMQSLIAYELTLAEKQDDTCHQVSEA